MATGTENPPIAENLNTAATMFLKMDKKEFANFEPRNTCEAAAHSLCVSSLRGDVSAFRELYNAADQAALIQEPDGYTDALSEALQELGESLQTYA